jgi:excisionase family DNA binding protein
VSNDFLERFWLFRVGMHWRSSCSAVSILVEGLMSISLTLLIDRAAAFLGVSRRTVYYRISEGRLRTIRTRCGSQRVLIESAEALLRQGPRRRRQRGRGRVSDASIT